MTDFDQFWSTACTQLSDFDEDQARWLWSRAQEAQEQYIRELEALCEWQPIETAPCDDTWALVYSIDGMMHIEDLDHDSDWQWWAERGATHWMHLPEPPR